MTSRSSSRILGKRVCAIRVAMAVTSACLALLALATTVYAQSTPTQPQSPQSTQSKSEPAPAPEQIGDLKLSLEKHEDWTQLSVKGLGLEPSHPLAGGTTDRPQFTRELIRLQWRRGDPVDIYVSLPKGVSKPRVVLYLYGYNNDASRFTSDDWCAGAIKGGFAAVGFVSALTGERYHAPRPMKEWFVSELQESLATTTHDVQMILNYLETRGDLNMDRVAMYGQGSGASIAILAASVDPRIKVLDLLNPWGDWPDWLKQSAWVPDAERPDYLKPEFLEKVASLDPVQVLPKLTTPVVRLQQVKDDRVTPTAAREKIAAAVPHGAAVLQSDSWQEYWKAFKQQNLWDWAREQLEPAATAQTAKSGQ